MRMRHTKENFTCPQCGKEFQEWRSQLKGVETPCCSRKCGIALVAGRFVQRFWQRVEKSEGCWIWTAHIGTDGYGTISVGASPVKAHRLSWIIHFGAVEPGMCVCHTCDNKICVRPDHLFLGTIQDNTADRDAKGRQCRGERHPDAKLTEEQVRLIRLRYRRGCPVDGVRPLAREFGLCRSSMRAVVSRETWRGVLP